MSLLNPARLRSEVEARETRKIKVFEHILDLCYHKIMITNQQCDDCCCIFMCPSVVFGMPLFNLMDCIRFIMMKLVEKGFEVHLAIPNNIFISWKKESNPDYSRQMYLLEAPTTINGSGSRGNNLALMPSGIYNNKKYTSSNSGINSGSNRGNSGISSGSSSGNSEGNYKLFSSKPGNKKEKEKNYRPIEDYRQTNIGSSNGGYASSLDDIDLFHSKLDELLA